MEIGQADFNSGGTIGFTPHKFSQTLVVVVSVIRSVYNDLRPLNVCITSANTDSFTYLVKYADGSDYCRQLQDKLNWIALVPQ